MTYTNAETGFRVSLDDLNDVERSFYADAQRRFRDNVDWFAFDAFAFGRHSPLYRGRRSHHEVLRSPLYLALRDMSLQLGVQQGKVARQAVTGRSALA